MANQNEIRFGVGFDLDKSSLNILKASLRDLRKLTVDDMIKINPSSTKEATSQLDQIKRTARSVESALDEAFNPKLNTVNLQAFSNKIGDIKKIHAEFAKAGAVGENAFRSLAHQVTSTNIQLRESHKILDEMATTFANSIKWNIASSAVNRLTGSLEEAYGYIKALDGSLNDIRIVTGKNADSMKDFAVEANEAAKALGTQTTNYTKSALTFYQQGLGEEEVRRRAEISTKVSNVTDLSGEQSAEYVTAILNGFKVTSEGAELALDKVAAVAADTASDLGELSEGMSKVASAANALGVTEDQLNAILATNISVTRQSASTAGTAFKTIFARMADIEAGSDEAEVSLGEYSGKMAELGFNVLDSAGHLRNLGEVIEEIGGKWADLSREQQISLARTMAGTRQYNNLISVFDNWDEYLRAVNTSMEANGTLQNQQNIYMDSTKAHLEELKASMEDIYDSLVEPKAINDVVDAMTLLANITARWIDGLGGGAGVLLNLGAIATRVFNKQIGKSIGTTIGNLEAGKRQTEEIKQVLENIDKAKENADDTTKGILEQKKKVFESISFLDPEEFNTLKEEFDFLVNKANEVTEVEGKIKSLRERIGQSDKISLEETSEEERTALSNEIEKTEKKAIKLEKTLRKIRNAIKTDSEDDFFFDRIDSIENNIKALELEDESFNKVKKAINKYKDALEGVGEEDFVSAASDLAVTLERELNSALEYTEQDIKELGGPEGLTSLIEDLIKKTKEFDSAKADIDAKSSSIIRDQDISNMVEFVSAIESYGAAVANIGQLGRIWSEKDVSTGDKWLQTITNLTTSIPMLIQGFVSLIKTGGLVKESFNKIKKNFLELIVTEKKKMLADSGVIAGENALTGVNNKLALSFKVLGEAIKSNPMTFWMTILSGVISVASIGINVFKQLRENQIENARVSIENADKIKDELQAEQDLYDKMNGLLEKFQETGEGRRELEDAILENLKAYGLESDAIDILAGKYDLLIDKIKGAREERLSQGIEETKVGIGGSKTLLGSQGIESSGNFSQLSLFVGSTSRDEKEAIDILKAQAEKNNLDFASERESEVLYSKTGNVLALYTAAEEAYREMLTSMTKEQQNKSEVFKELVSYLNENRETAEKLKAQQEELGKLAQEKASLEVKRVSPKDIKSISDYQSYKEEYQESLKQSLGGGDINKIEFDETKYKDVQEYLDFLTDSYAETFAGLKEIAIATDLKEALLPKDAKTSVFSKNFVPVSEEEKKTSQEEIQKYLESLSDEDWQVLVKLGIDEYASLETIQVGLNLFKTELQNQLPEAVESSVETISNLVSKEKELSEKELETKQAAEDTFNAFLMTQESLHGMIPATEEWENAIREGPLAEAMYLNDFLERQNQFKLSEADMAKRFSNELSLIVNKQEDILKRVDEIKAKGENVTDEEKAELEELTKKFQDLQDQAEEISSKKYSLKLEVDIANADALHSWADTVIAEADALRSAIAGIGEGFTISADAARKFAEVFPEILDGAIPTTDGLLKLNEEYVRAALKGKYDIITADKKTLLEAIKIKIQDLTIKRDQAKKELEFLEANQKSEITLGQLALKYKEETGITETQIKEDINNVINSSNEKASLAAAENSTNLSNTVIENNKREIESYNRKAEAIQNSSRGQATSLEGLNGAVNTFTPVSLENIETTNENGVFKDRTSQIDLQTDEAQTLLQNLIEAKRNEYETYREEVADLIVEQADIINAINSLEHPKKDKKESRSKHKRDPKHKELLKDEIDIYKSINAEIDLLSESLKRLEKEQDKASGREVIDNLNKQLTILEKQEDAYNRKLALMKKESSALQQMLEAHGVTFDENGLIENYEQVLLAKQKHVNAVYAAYNKMSAEEQDKYESTIKATEADYNNFKKQLEDYEKLMSKEIPELQSKIEDTLYKQIELQIEKFDMTIQLHLDMAEAEREWNEFKRKVIDDLDDDDILGHAEQGYRDYLTYYKGGTAGKGSIESQTAHVNKILQEIKTMEQGGHSEIYSAYDEASKTWVDNKGQAVEDLQAAYKDLMKDLEAVEDLEDDVKQTFLDSIDAVQDSYNAQQQSFELLDAQLEHDMKLMQLLYGDKAYHQMDKYYKKQISNTKAELASQREAAAFWKAKADQERLAIAAGKGDKDALAKYEENWKESLGNVNQLIDKWSEEVTAKYANTIDGIINDLNNKLSDGLGLEYLDEELSLINNNSENYLDNINRAYAIQKLTNKWQDAINNADSVSTQEELNKLMDKQLEQLEKKGKLTQYDIDRAEKEYQIALKQLALQNAQQNKSKMRLKRDAAGNWNYQFVSDEDNIRQAQLELAEAQNELYNFDKTAYQNNLNEMYATWNEFQQKVADAYKTYANDQDALNEHIALLQEQYGEKINFLTEQNLSIRNNLTQSAYTELAEMYNTDVQNFQSMSEEERNILMEQLVPQWDSGVQQMIDKMAGEGGFDEVCRESFKRLEEEADRYKTELDSIQHQNGEMTREAYEQGQLLLEQSKQLTNASIEEYNRVTQVLDQVMKLRDAYKSAKEEAIAANEAAYKYVQDEAKRKADAAAEKRKQEEAKKKPASNGKGSSSGGSSSKGKGGQGDGRLAVGDKATFTGRYYYDSFGKSPAGSRYSGVEKGVVVDIVNNNPYGAHIHSADGKFPDLGWVKKSQLKGYDTGGYTGDWGSDGRLALLHQKELVLNKQDTKNMLDAVTILRGVVSSIGDRAFARTASMLDGIGIKAAKDSSSQENFEQNVYINAKFEGQTEATQIQAALNNLVNAATQKANRRKR